jgi:glycosyltransferase involved in cell wall biosynthesis
VSRVVKNSTRNWPLEAPESSVIASLPGGAWPRVTIVTPSYNQARFLESTILSVVNQEYPDLEYIVIDGRSTDGSVEIIQKYNDQLAYWESEPDKGQAHAINKGWRRATGKYLWWLNSDDMLTPNSLKIAVRYLEENPEIDLVYGDDYRIDEQGRIFKRKNYRDFNFESFIVHGFDISQAGALMRRATQGQIDLLREDLHLLMDKELWLRVALEGRRIAHLPVPLALFRIHEHAKTQEGGKLAAEERLKVTEWLLNYPRLPESILNQREKIYGDLHVQCARVYMKGGKYQSALREVVRGLQRDQLQVFRSSVWITFLLSLLGIIIGYKRIQNIRHAIRRVRNFLRKRSIF